MYSVRKALGTADQLGLAVRAQSPADLARHFAAHVGQFYDRDRFDALARATRDLYARDSGESAERFRQRLDHRLRERHATPIAWDRVRE